MTWNYKTVKIKIKYLQYSKSYRSYVCKSRCMHYEWNTRYGENVQWTKCEIIIIVSHSKTYDAFNKYMYLTQDQGPSTKEQNLYGQYV